MYVGLTGTESIAGVKTFSSVPVCATQPTSNSQLANKEYVDSAGGTPANMMTTDTEQDITAVKTFQGGMEITNGGNIAMFGNQNQISQNDANATITQLGSPSSITQGGTGSFISQSGGNSYISQTGGSCNINQNGSNNRIIQTQPNSFISSQGYITAQRIMGYTGYGNQLSFYMKGYNNSAYWNASPYPNHAIRWFRADEVMNGNSSYRSFSAFVANPGGRMYFKNSAGRFDVQSFGVVYLLATGYWSSSDDRLKHKEEYITNALETLCKLRPQKYLKYDPDTQTEEEGVWDAGLIAQEVWYDAPELRFIVKTPPDADPQPLDRPYDPQDDPDYEKFGWTEATSHLDYTALGGYIVQAIKELDAKNKELDAKNKELEARLEKIEQHLNMNI